MQGRAGASYGKFLFRARGDTNLNCYLSWPKLFSHCLKAANCSLMSHKKY